jgi:hypothetical protein
VEDMTEASRQAIEAVVKHEGYEKMVDKNTWMKTMEEKLKEGDRDERIIVLVQGPEQKLLEIQRRLESKCPPPLGKKKLCLLLANTSVKGQEEERDFSRFDRSHQKGQGRKATEIGVGFWLSHQLVGGVVDHSWEFRFNQEVTGRQKLHLGRQSAVKAAPQDFLSTTESGRHIKAPNKEPVDKIPWKRRIVEVDARSVFSSSGWVRRKITEKELMLMYDVGVQDGELMRNWVETKGSSLTTDFTQQVPIRVLLRCLELLQKEKLVEVWEKGEKEPLSKGGMKIGNPNLDLEGKLKEIFSQGPRDQEVSTEEEKLAAKNDDAQVKVHQWNLRVCNGLGIVYCATIHEGALDKLRILLLHRYKSFHSGVIGSFRRYMRTEYGDNWLMQMRTARRSRRCGKKNIVLDYKVGMDAIHRALASTFWEWEDGSTVMFWRWPREVRNELRDGLRVWYRDRDLPSYWGRQRWPENSKQREQLKEKITKVISRRYITSGYVKSLTSFFSVPKGTEDVRVVYDATKSGLNAAIWSPNFFLPTASSVLNNATENTFFGDIDLGEMFLNFFLDERLRPLAGVDVSALLPESQRKKNGEEQHRLILRWERSLMGVRSSPFNCVKAYLWSEDIIKGNPRDKVNPFKWDRVILNFPGSEGYDPSRPWIYKYDSEANKLAAFVVSYVDDLRTGDDGGKESCDRATHHVAARLNYLGEQDAARKRGEASKRPGAWAGSVIEAIEREGLFVSVSQEKWNKVQGIIQRYYQDAIDVEMGKEVWVDFKQLEQDTGFMVHVMMTFENLRPYLKGFYLTLNEWRFDRDDEGWKLGRRHWEELAENWVEDGGPWEEAKHAEGRNGKLEPPRKVRIVTQFARDIRVLRDMFVRPSPTKRLIRGKRIARVLYGFGDASGAGFGTSWEVLDHGKRDKTGDSTTTEEIKISYRFGRWGQEGIDTSSNYRELRNLVDSLETMGNNGELSGVEVFLFTDNSTAESACARGSSSCKSLFELVKRLKLLEMLFRTRVHVVHVAGKRMIAQGADGLSRGCLSEGVMQGDRMTAFVPLHKTAVDRSLGLAKWISDCCDVKGHSPFRLLGVKDWYELGHDIIGGSHNADGIWLPDYAPGNFIWAPAPCVAVQCLEELRKARHKRQVSAHVFICPRIMTALWQRQLFKSADLVVRITPGHPHWTTEQHEPLIVGFYFPYLKDEPWQLKGTPKILGMARRLQRVCKTNPISTGRVLRQLWEFARKLPEMPKHVVFQMLQGTGDDSIPQATSRKRRRSSLEEEEG